MECSDMPTYIQYRYGAFCFNGQASIRANWWSSSEFTTAQEPPHHVAPESRPVLNLQTKSGWYRKLRDTQGNARWYKMNPGHAKALGWLNWNSFWVVHFVQKRQAADNICGGSALPPCKFNSGAKDTLFRKEAVKCSITIHPTSF